MWISENWKDYELIDTTDNERLERWGKYILIRPDPQIIWKNTAVSPLWKKADAKYSRSSSGGGEWSKNKLPAQWQIKYGELTFTVRPMGFKHTGIFPEQATNWDWFSSLIKKSNRPIKVLNMFAYTGGATMAAAAAGASVTHVDAAKGMVNIAKENASLSGLSDRPIRYIVDDCKKFAEREIKRGNKYDAIIMDPPSYGRGPGGEIWKIEESIDELIGICANLMSDKPLFFLLNSYTTGLSPLTMSYIINKKITSKFGGATDAGELALPVSASGLPLPCGASVRWQVN